MRVRVLVLFGMVMLPASMPPAAAAPTGKAPASVTDPWPEVEAFYKNALVRHHVAGSSLLVVRDGKVANRAVHGLQDHGLGKPVTEDTIFHWASITKTFTGIAILQLRDRGLLSLDDPIVKYLPELRQVRNPFGDMSQVKLRHLMSHSAGFRAPTWPWSEGKDWEPFEPPRYEQVQAMLPYTEHLFAPGSRFSYSNPGVVFLGRTIEVLTNEDYEVYVDKNVLRPLGMHRSFFDRTPPHLLAHRSHSYFYDEKGLREARFDFDTGVTVSNGGLNAPFPDMARYLAFLLGDPSRQAEHDVVLKRSSLEEMWKPLVKVEEEGGSAVYMGLSFFLERRFGLDLVAHSGTQNGFLSHFFLHVPSRTAYLVAYNTQAGGDEEKDVAPDGTSTRKLDAELRDYLLSKLFAPKAGR
jgi:CubicO group peptidase (beta-lactamase class C family)